MTNFILLASGLSKTVSIASFLSMLYIQGNPVKQIESEMESSMIDAVVRVGRS